MAASCELAKCSTTLSPAAVLQVACTLTYSDLNVTQVAPGSRIKLCKPSWSDVQEFNAVAMEVGSGRGDNNIPETQQVWLADSSSSNNSGRCMLCCKRWFWMSRQAHICDSIGYVHVALCVVVNWEL